MNERIAENMKCWDQIAVDVSKNRLLGFLQPSDREVALSEAQWEFVQRHDLISFPHRGQAIAFASRCIQHWLRRESVQMRRFYGPKLAVDDTTSWTEQLSPSSSAIPPLEAIAAPAPEPEDHRLAAIMEISPTVAQICSLYLEGFTRQETAQIMNVTPAQILYDLQIAKTAAERQFNQPALLRVPVSSIRRRSGRTGRPAKTSQPAVAQQMLMF